MPLEDLTGTTKYINSLVVTNPDGADSKSDGDNHIRGIKNTIKNTFPNITGPVTVNQAELNLLAGMSTINADKVDGYHILKGSLTNYNFGIIAAHSYASTTISLSGAAFRAPCLAAPKFDSFGLNVSAFISSSNIVTIVVHNMTTGSFNVGIQSVDVLVFTQ